MTCEDLPKLLDRLLGWPLWEATLDDLTYELKPAEVGLLRFPNYPVDRVLQLRSIPGLSHSVYIIDFGSHPVRRHVLRYLGYRVSSDDRYGNAFARAKRESILFICIAEAGKILFGRCRDGSDGRWEVGLIGPLIFPLPAFQRSTLLMFRWENRRYWLENFPNESYQLPTRTGRRPPNFSWDYARAREHVFCLDAADRFAGMVFEDTLSTLSNWIVDPLDYESEVLERLDNQRRIARVLSNLKPREQEVMMLRNGVHPSCAEGTMTLEAVSVRLGLTRERVRQIEMRANKRLASLRALAAAEPARRAECLGFDE
jgi:hypothetical protein